MRIVPSAIWEDLTGEEAPARPANPRLFAALGYPWFEYDESEMDDIDPAEPLRDIKSVDELDPP